MARRAIKDRRYGDTERGRATRRAAQARYRETTKGRATNERYENRVGEGPLGGSRDRTQREHQLQQLQQSLGDLK
jgi:hypothetical protein